MDELFVNEDTSLDDIVAAGWYIDRSSGGGWWFRHRESKKRQPVPRWIEEMVFNAQQAGMCSMRSQLQSLLLDDEEPHYVGPCNPFIPAKDKVKA